MRAREPGVRSNIPSLCRVLGSDFNTDGAVKSADLRPRAARWYHAATMASRPRLEPARRVRRSFLKTAAAAPPPRRSPARPRSHRPRDSAQATGGGAPLMAYVGTFSSPLRDVLPTQVDLPPGNGRGIHIFEVDRATGALAPRGTFDLGTSPSCLALNRAATRLYSSNETDRVGEGKEGTVSAFAIGRADGRLTELNTVASGGAGPHLCERASVGEVPARGQLLRRLRGGAADSRRRPPRARDRREAGCRHGGAEKVRQRAARELRVQRPRPDARAHDPGRSIRALRPARGPGARSDLRVEVRRSARRAHARRSPRSGAAAGRRPAALRVSSRRALALLHPGGRLHHRRSSTGTARAGASRRGRPSRACRPAMPAATSARRYSCRPTAGSCTAATGCTTASGSSPWAATGELTFVADEWTRGNYPRSFAFDPTGGSSIAATSGPTTSPCSARTRRPAGWPFTGQYTPVGNPSSIVFADLAKAR